jgi:hypothetical protein
VGVGVGVGTLKGRAAKGRPWVRGRRRAEDPGWVARRCHLWHEHGALRDVHLARDCEARAYVVAQPRA